MIKFFRKIRYQLLGEGKTSKYLKYAIGEVVLIIAGVLIALSAANWNSDRINSLRETKTLKEIYKGLKADYSALNVLIENTESGINSITYLDSMLKEESPTYSSSMDTLFGAVYGFRFFSFEKVYYEDLKSNNLNLIESDSLRQQLILVYESLHSLNEKNYDTEVWVNDELRPYYLKNFRNLTFTKSATPIDFRLIWEDDYYKNLVNYRLTFLERVSISSYILLRLEFEKLIKLIDAYLFD